MDESSGVLVLAWNDNRPVIMLTTIDDLDPMHSVRRWSAKEKKRIQIEQPNTVACYNKHMGGVDRMDQNINNYTVSIGSKKWWWSCFCFGVDTAVHNAWQLYRKVHPKWDYLQFCRYVATSYMQTYGSPPTGPGRRSSQDRQLTSKRVNESVRLDKYNHWIATTDLSLHCGVCDGRTNKKCEKCNVGLHPVPCFKEFHVKN